MFLLFLVCQSFYREGGCALLKGLSVSFEVMICFLSESLGCIIVSGGEVCMHAHNIHGMK